jgi:DNA-binding MarR family transcriptional regulator/GNAT superfamily N-acetyltransferase
MGPATIEQVRAASRQLVRELGFMQTSLAGTDLPPSAVHALIEIEARTGITAGELADRLRLEKSSVSRMLRKLIESGEVHEESGARDGRTKPLVLSDRGRSLVHSIHGFARAQVAEALARLAPPERDTVLEGLRLYAGALAAGKGTQDTAAEASPSAATCIESGYRIGLIARLTEMHARYYARAAGFGAAFEAVVARDLAEFAGRLARPCNAIWAATLGEHIGGGVAIDGEDLAPGIAHLRWFIVDDGLRGGGLGRRLLRAALDFADAQGFVETHLWTFRGLEAARHLYEAHGFALAEERTGRQWGSEVLEQRFVRKKP